MKPTLRKLVPFAFIVIPCCWPLLRPINSQKYVRRLLYFMYKNLQMSDSRQSTHKSEGEVLKLMLISSTKQTYFETKKKLLHHCSASAAFGEVHK